MNYEKLEQWRAAALDLELAKTLEMRLRKELATECFSTLLEGANTLELQGGWVLKLNQPFIRSLDQAKAPEVLKALKKLKADGAVKIKYDLSLAVYRGLEGQARALVDDILTTKPGSPSLELVAPK